MIGQLMILRKKWNIGIIDLYTDENLTILMQEERISICAIPYIRTKAGYLKWWLPKRNPIYSYIV